MRRVLTVAALAKNTGASPKAIRYWERLGLIRRAARSHSGYRLFGPEAEEYVEFIRKSKTMGLSLKQMRRVLELARGGHSPCPQVEGWIEQKLALLQRQIQSLRAIEKSLRSVQRSWHGKPSPSNRSGEACSLIVNLPEGKPFLKGKQDEKTLQDRTISCSGGRK